MIKCAQLKKKVRRNDMTQRNDATVSSMKRGVFTSDADIVSEMLTHFF